MQKKLLLCLLLFFLCGARVHAEMYGVIFAVTQRVISSTGEEYVITVTYGPEAGIPEDAVLKAQEILAGTADYEHYLADYEKETLVDVSSVEIARFFDIEIRDGNGEKIEPASPVSVCITLQDMPEDTHQSLVVVHFAEDGPQLMDTSFSQNGETSEMSFQTDGFSTYGVITAPTPTSANNLVGYSVKIGVGGNYLLSQTDSSTSPHKIKKGSFSDAAEWIFEATDSEGVYNIYTVIDGTQKYLSFQHYSDHEAHVTLSDTPQDLHVNQSAYGTYQISWTDEGVTYYLNQNNGNAGTGFAGYYATADYNSMLTFSFTTPSLTEDEEYMVLVKIGEDYYIVLNDGELEKTKNPVNYNAQKVGADTPLMWYYNGTNLYHPAEAVAYNDVTVASDYYYRYIDPRQADALSMDNAGNTTQQAAAGGGYTVTSRDLMDDTQIMYDEATHTLSSAKDSSKVLKVVEKDGTYYIAGGDSVGEQAEVYLAKMTNTNYLHIGERYHTVDHIDISVEATTGIHVPLAYGTYYYVENGQVKTLVVSQDNHVTLSLLKNDINVTKDDLKDAEIIAYKKDADGKQVIVPDAYTITGYSSNSENSSSTEQVRIAGAFKVADLPATTHSVNGDDEWRKQRLENRIYYSVSTTKDVPFNLEYNGCQLYERSAAAAASLEAGYDVKKDENALTIHSMVTLSASFDYWDYRNECPGIHRLGHTNSWTKGDIFCNETSMTENSGMDFALGTSATSDTNSLAIEISKYLVDSNGHLITPNQELNHVFHVYRKPISKNAAPNPIDEVKGLDVDGYDPNQTQPSLDGYTLLHDKTVTVGDGGMGIVYDYDMSAGMIYIQEDALQKQITDIYGKNWDYVETHFETEYVWRNDGIENRRHVSQTYSSEAEALNSIPDVLGAYRDIDGIDQYNGFLEFYCYNVYQPEPMDITVEKIWKHKNGSPANAPEGAVVTVQLGRFKLTEDPEHRITGDLLITQNITGLPDDASFQATYKVKQNNIVVRTGSYNAQAGGATITGLPSGEYTLEISSSVEGYDVTNTPEAQPVTIENGETTEATFKSTIQEKEVVKTIKVRVTNSIDGAPSYQDALYTFPAGSQIAVNISRPGPGHNPQPNGGGGFHVTVKVNGQQVAYTPPEKKEGEAEYAGVTQTLLFDLPETQEEGSVFLIEIWHDWSPENLWVNSVSQYHDASTTGGTAPKTTMARKATSSLASPKEASAQADDEKIPDSPIPGMLYKPDETWGTEENPVTLVLRGTTWKKTLEDLDATDENGNKYLYYIKSVQEEGMPEGTDMTIDLKEGKILASSGDDTLTVTNQLPNEPPSITLRKVDENGFPMTGVTFTVTKDGGEPEEIQITNADGTYVLASLPAGTYLLQEEAWPDAFTQMPGSISFTVDQDYKVIPQNLPAGVSFEEDTFTLKVVNEPKKDPDSLRIRKQWLDFYGNSSAYEGTVNLTLEQWVYGDPIEHTVKFLIKCEGDGAVDGHGDIDYEGQVYLIATRTGKGVGDVSLHWDWDQYTDDKPFTVSGLEGSTYKDTKTNGGQGKGGHTITVQNVTTDLTVTIVIQNGGWKGTASSLIKNPSFDGNNPHVGPLVSTNGKKTVTLGEEGEWIKTFSLSGDGLLSNASQTIPKTYNQKTCYYTISEESVPEGYTLAYISSDPIHSGMLTAYNRKNDLDLTVVKTDETYPSQKLGGATFVLRQLDPAKTGNIDLRYLVGTSPKEKTTASDGAAKGNLVFPQLEPGFYELKETKAPDGYLIEGEAAVYFRVTETEIEMLQADTQNPAENWHALSQTANAYFQNGSLYVTNKPGVALPATGGPGTHRLYLLGLLFITLGAALLWPIRIMHRR